MRRYTFVFQAITLFCLIGAVAGFFLWLWQENKPQTLSTEAEKTKELCDKINLEMPEQEVDALLAEYESSTGAFEREEDSHGRPLIRTAYHTKYYIKKGAIEGDYCIQVYLDNSYWKRVVGKTWSELLK